MSDLRKPTGSSGPSGTGTTNTIPKWTAAAVLGNSSVTDTGVVVTTSIPVQMPDGSAGTPSLSFTSDPTSGIFFHSSGVMALSAGGSVAARITPEGLRATDGSQFNPSHSFFGDPDTGMFQNGPDKLGFTAGAVKMMSVESALIETYGPIHVPDGTAATPAVAFTSAPGTGLYSDSTDQISVSTTGTEAATIDRNYGVGAYGFHILPSIGGDLDSGIYLDAAFPNTTLAIFIMGTKVLQLNSAGIATINGSATAPALSFVSDPDLGLYRIGADILGLSVAGSESARLDSTGLTLAGSVKTANPSGGTAQTWKLGSVVAAASALDAANYVQVEINGVAYKLALIV